MHRHRDSHGIARSLTECGRGAAHEKSARDRGREPEAIHNSDELTNSDAAAQQNVPAMSSLEGTQMALVRG